MSQKMYVCPECGFGYLGVDSCPRCHSEGSSDRSEIHVPWFRTHTNWAQQRIDGTTWFLYDSGPEPTDMKIVDVATRICQAGKHSFVGTRGASCPVCNPAGSRQKPAASQQGESKKRGRNWAIAAVLLIVIAGIVGAVTMTSSSDPVASRSSTTIAEAPATTTAALPVADPGFLDAVAYEADLLAIGTRAEQVGNRVLEINAQWDNREITQEEAARELARQKSEARRIAGDVDAAANHGADKHRHAAVSDASEELVDATEAVRDGLLEPGSRSGRDDATVWTVGVTDQLLEAIDDALDFDSIRLQRDEGTPVPLESLRVGDCMDVEQEGDYTEIVACSQAGRGEVLATPVLPSSTDVDPLMCAKAALPFVDFEEFDATEGSWEIREGSAQGGDKQHICVYVPDTSTDRLVVNNTSHTGPFASDQWDALARLGLAPSRSFEVGECFNVPLDDESDLVNEQSAVECADDHDFSLSAVVAVAPTEGATGLDRISLRSWEVCADSVASALGGESYLVSDATVYPTFPGLGDPEAPMLTLACALVSEGLGSSEVVPLDDYQSGYAFAFIGAQALVYFGRIEDPQTTGDIQYNKGFDAAHVDVTNRRFPSTEVTDEEWIAAYLRGNPTGWDDGRGCTRPNPYPVPPGMNEVETDGWYAGYNAGFDSACNVGTAAPAWVGKSVCPYDPWEVHAMDQDILCPPVRP